MNIVVPTKYYLFRYYYQIGCMCISEREIVYLTPFVEGTIYKYNNAANKPSEYISSK